MLDWKLEQSNRCIFVFTSEKQQHFTFFVFLLHDQAEAQRTTTPWLQPPHQKLQWPGYRGNGIESRMFSSPVQIITNRSKPRPNPAWGTVPKRLRSRYHCSDSLAMPTSAMRCCKCSMRSSLWLPPMISPTQGSNMSMAATVSLPASHPSF